MSQTEDLARLLAERGHGSYVADATGGSIFLGELPPEPAAAIVVTPYPGAAGSARIGYDRPRYQITVRDPDYRTAETTAKTIYGDLAGLGNRALGPAWLALIAPIQSGPIWTRPEADGRTRFAINFELHLHQPTPNRA